MKANENVVYKGDSSDVLTPGKVYFIKYVSIFKPDNKSFRLARGLSITNDKGIDQTFDSDLFITMDQHRNNIIDDLLC